MIRARPRRMTGILLAAALLVGVSALVIGAAVRSSFFGRVGPQADATGVTPNRWMLTPAGLQIEVAVIDTATGERRPDVKLARPEGVDEIGPLPYALALAGQKLYVSEWNGGGVSVIDTVAGTVAARIPTGGHASGLALSSDGA